MVMMQRSHRFGVGVVVLLSVLTAAWAHAAITGKIAGTVRDKKTKDVLIGVPVVVLGTSFGALTDLDGRFVILSVPAGEHSVRASLIGYTDVITSNVRVHPDLTSTLEIELEQSTIELPAIQVIRERELIQMDEASTKRDITERRSPACRSPVLPTFSRLRLGSRFATISSISVEDGRRNSCIQWTEYR